MNQKINKQFGQTDSFESLREFLRQLDMRHSIVPNKFQRVALK